MCALIPRQHQVNLPSFPSLTSHFSSWWSWGTVVTPRPRRTAVEAAVGSPGCPPPPAPGSRPYGPAAAAAGVRSERGRSLRPARCSLCASESRRPTSLSALPTPAGPPAPGLSPLPSLLFLCCFSLHFSLGLLPYPVKTIKGKDLESKLEGRALFPPPPPPPQQPSFR